MLNGGGFLIGIWVICLEGLGRVKQQKNRTVWLFGH